MNQLFSGSAYGTLRQVLKIREQSERFTVGAGFHSAMAAFLHQRVLAGFD
jgi:hypothetical protein